MSPTAMNMVVPYYDNPRMLEAQIHCWNSYVGILRTVPEVLLVDDGSPVTPALEVVRGAVVRVPLRVFRIGEDIPWNVAGARNLGCLHAHGWIYMTDVDTLLPAAEAARLFEARALEAESVYTPRRVWLPHLRRASPAVANLLFHKEKFLAVGGYDEDFSGSYGSEDVDYLGRLRQVARLVCRDDAVVTAVPPQVIRDARTATRFRDKRKNRRLLLEKIAAGHLRPTHPLRFSWTQVW